MNRKIIDENHAVKKTVFKILGLILLFLGIILVIISIKSTMSPSFDPFYGHDRSGLAFIGIPLIFVGAVLTSLGFMGEVAKYESQEMAPTAKNTFNYMAHGTKEGVKNISKAISEGVKSSKEEVHTAVKIRCHKCNKENESSAKFCSNCGAPLMKSKKCIYCGEMNDPDAKFCDNCGRKF